LNRACSQFPDAVELACGQRPKLPDWLADLGGKPERVTTIAVDQQAVERAFHPSVALSAKELLRVST
jgi:threonine synthase